MIFRLKQLKKWCGKRNIMFLPQLQSGSIQAMQAIAEQAPNIFTMKFGMIQIMMALLIRSILIGQFMMIQPKIRTVAMVR